MVYQTGILRLLPLVFRVFLGGLFCTFLCHWYWVVDLYRDDRKAEPLERLERAKVLFLDRLSYRINASSLQKVCILTQGKKLCFLRFFFWFSFIHMYHRLGKWLESINLNSDETWYVLQSFWWWVYQYTFYFLIQRSI
jgi:hypothetical protein